MTDQEATYKAEAEHWKSLYLKLLKEVKQMRGFQRQKKKAGYLTDVDNRKLYNLQRLIDKKVEDAEQDLKLMFIQPEIFR